MASVRGRNVESWRGVQVRRTAHRTHEGVHNNATPLAKRSHKSDQSNFSVRFSAFSHGMRVDKGATSSLFSVSLPVRCRDQCFSRCQIKLTSHLNHVDEVEKTGFIFIFIMNGLFLVHPLCK